MQIQTEASSNHLESRIVNELPSVERFKIRLNGNSRLSSAARHEALRTLYPDSDVAMRVLRALKDRHFSSLQALDVNVHRSVATITGEVNSFYEKQIAMSACQSVPGVLRLIDQIGVRECLGERD